MTIVTFILVISLTAIYTQAFILSNVESNRLRPFNPITTRVDTIQLFTFSQFMGIDQNNDKQEKNLDEAEDTKFDVENFLPNKPIELDSLRPQTTFLGLEPKDDKTRQLDSELPLFTSTVVLGMSLYFIYLALFGEDIVLDPSMPLAF